MQGQENEAGRPRTNLRIGEAALAQVPGRAGPMAATPSRREESPYRRWQKGQGIPINRGAFVPDLHTLQVTPWPRMGRHNVGAHLVVLDGQGHSLMWFQGKEARARQGGLERRHRISPRDLEYHQHCSGQ